MKNRFFLLHPKVLLRGGIVLAISAIFGSEIIGPSLSKFFNDLYMQTYSPFWREIFYYCSQNRVLLVCIGCIAIFVATAGWIFRPLFKEYSDIVRRNIKIDKDAIDINIQLPKNLKELEAVLNEVNTALRLSRYAVKEADQRKDDLVVHLAHDIRTPLTSVLGYLELLTENRDLSEQQRQKFMDSALRKARRMQALVEELFEITHYSITQIELEKSPVNLGMMITQLVEELRPVFEQRELNSEVILDEISPVYIDPDKIARSLDNVLHNAAYYTPPGGKITVRLDNLEEHTRISISNTGIEIPPDKLARFFEKFYRGDESRPSDIGGSGLGLAIAKNIIEAHGGTITAENEDRITTFTILI